MFILPLQWDRHSGPDAVGTHKLTFAMDESILAEDFNPMRIKKGTQFLAIFLDPESNESEKFKKENGTEAKERFQKWMHALINEIAKYSDTDQRDVKRLFKNQLKNLGLIQESTTELTLDGYAQAINILRERLNEYRN